MLAEDVVAQLAGQVRGAGDADGAGRAADGGDRAGAAAGLAAELNAHLGGPDGAGVAVKSRCNQASVPLYLCSCVAARRSVPVFQWPCGPFK